VLSGEADGEAPRNLAHGTREHRVLDDTMGQVRAEVEVVVDAPERLPGVQRDVLEESDEKTLGTED
jgi:hypothetical protein